MHIHKMSLLHLLLACSQIKKEKKEIRPYANYSASCSINFYSGLCFSLLSTNNMNKFIMRCGVGVHPPPPTPTNLLGRHKLQSHSSHLEISSAIFQLKA